MDKKKAEEKQELAKLFAKNVNEAIHIISEKQGWKDGSPEKIALHSFFAGIEGELSGNGFMSGALAGGVNEAAVAKLMKTLGPNNPDLVQMASAALGYATNKLAGEDALAGAALAQWGTKWNSYEEYAWEILGFNVTKKKWMQHALREALVVSPGTKNERMLLNLGDGDKIWINVGHAYYRIHRGQDALGLPPLSYTNKEDVLLAVSSYALQVALDKTQETGVAKPYHINMFIKGYDNKFHYALLEMTI